MNQYDTELIQQRDNNYVYKIKGKKAGSFKEAMGINYGVYDDCSSISFKGFQDYVSSISI